MAFHTWKNEATGERYGSFEVFYNDTTSGNPLMIDGYLAEGGWYWWACFPGCFPGSDPYGPFETEQQAIDDANEQDAAAWS